MAVAENNTKNRQRNARNVKQINIFRREIRFEARARWEMRRRADRERADKHRRREGVRTRRQASGFALLTKTKRKRIHKFRLTIARKTLRAHRERRRAGISNCLLRFKRRQGKQKQWITKRHWSNPTAGRFVARDEPTDRIISHLSKWHRCVTAWKKPGKRGNDFAKRKQRTLKSPTNRRALPY